MAENRPQNTTANHSVPSDPSAINWGNALDYWTKFTADRNQVTGNYTGTTDEILQWVACKWGIDEDVVVPRLQRHVQVPTGVRSLADRLDELAADGDHDGVR